MRSFIAEFDRGGYPELIRAVALAGTEHGQALAPAGAPPIGALNAGFGAATAVTARREPESPACTRDRRLVSAASAAQRR